MEIHYLLGTDLVLEPHLAATMFRDRTDQFLNRHEWPVRVNDIGFERDQYEHENPFYIIASGPNGAHLGSLRLLPTTGRTMINDHFLDCIGGKPIIRKQTWECSRFCISRNADRRTSVSLMAAAGIAMRELKIRKLVAVFDEPMIRTYRRTGASPHILGEAERNGAKVFGGIWAYDQDLQVELIKKSGIDPVMLEIKLANATLPRTPHLEFA